jgi:hypothetical protein
MVAVETHITNPPPVLVVTCEYRMSHEEKAGASDSTSIDLTRDDDEHRSSPQAKGRKGKSKAPVSPARKSKEDVKLNYPDVSGFVVNSQVTLDKWNYEYIGSIMHYPGHFWATVSYDGRIWYYGIGDSKDVHGGKQKVGEAIVLDRDLRGVPASHFYTKLNE